MKTQSELKVFSNNGYDYIYLDYSKDGKRIRINTKFQYDKNYCTKALMFNTKAEDYEIKNKAIEKLKWAVDHYIEKCIKDNRKISQKELNHFIAGNGVDVKESFPETRQKFKNLLQYYDEFLLTKKRELAESSYKNYKTLSVALNNYQESKKTKLTFQSINKEFCLDFNDWLLNQGLIDMTINKRFACLKVFLRDIEERDIFYFKPNVLRFSIKKFSSEIVTLTLDELKNLQKLDLKGNENWQKVLDVFILNCFMGLRYADLQQVKKSNFYKDQDNDFFYKTYNQKTQTEIIIPILPTAFAILQKYGFDIPMFHNVVFNRTLKDILTFHKLFEDQVIKHSMVNGNIREEKFMRRELISSHTCRRTFVTNSLKNNVNISNLMAATGHKKINTVSRYLERKTDKQDFKKLDQ